jgi:putative SOS response-associated peptidase YedK
MTACPWSFILPITSSWIGAEADPCNLLRPFEAVAMRMWPVSTRVNKPENDDASLLDEVPLPMPETV